MKSRFGISALSPAFIIFSLFVQVPVSANPQSGSAGKVGIAVLDFRQRTLTDKAASMRRQLTERLIEELSQIKGVYIVEREALNPFMRELSLSETVSIDPRTRQRLGKALSADLLIEGSILRRRHSWVVEFRGHDVRGKKTVFDGSSEIKPMRTLDLAKRISNEVKAWMQSRADDIGAQMAGPATLRTIGVFDFNHPNDPLLGSTIRTMMATEAFRIGRTGLVERENLDAVLRELYLQQSGAINPATRLKLGRILGATWIIYGKVEDSEKGGLLLSIKAAETETGRIILARQYRGQRNEIRSHLKSFSSEMAGALGERLERDSADSLEESKLFLARGGRGPGGYLSELTVKGMHKQVADLKRAIFLAPFSANPYLALARVLKFMYRFEEARLVLHSMIFRLAPDKLTPDDLVEAYFMLGELDWRLIDCENAVKHFRWVIKNKASEYKVNSSHLFIGKVLAFMGRDEEALEAYRSVRTDVSSGKDTANLRSAYLLERLGRFDEALLSYRKEVELREKYNDPPGATGFEVISPEQRISIIKEIRDSPTKAYRLLLDAELETQRHYWVSRESVDRTLKDNYDESLGDFTEIGLDALRDARMTGHLLKAIGILQLLLREHPRDPIVPDALWLLAECHRKRMDADYRLDVSTDVFPLYLRIVDDYPNFRLAEQSLVLASESARDTNGRRHLLQRLINYPDSSKANRQRAIWDLAQLLNSKRETKNEALALYQRFLEERDWMVQQGGQWQWLFRMAETQIESLETGRIGWPAEIDVRDCLKNGEFRRAGELFLYPPPKFEEAAWAFWAGFRFSRWKADNLLKFAFSLEKLGIHTEAIRRYQQVIDQFLETRGDLAKIAQARMDRLPARKVNPAKDAEKYAKLRQKFERMDEKYRDLMPRAEKSPHVGKQRELGPQTDGGKSQQQ